jgi:adenosine deaminase
LGVTAHAGETTTAGFKSVEDTLFLNPHRIGHGVCLGHDINHPVSRRIKEEGVFLEVCPASNIGTGFSKGYDDHPIDKLHRAGFKVTINTDNRLMSNVTLTDEMHRVHEAHNWALIDFFHVTMNAIEGAFASIEEKNWLRSHVCAHYQLDHNGGANSSIATERDNVSLDKEL